ncbi:hypothetical protein PINS_up020442 [Pythium insidiosum]|nr:hypothetical protein PINS_up007776 [Pythium insidiosum]GLE08967.1 hypothetical protein PINS_up020442 [Pythium insidiosum]
MQLGHPVVRQILALLLLGSAIVYSQNVTLVEDKAPDVPKELLPIKENVDPAALAEFENNNQTINPRVFPLLPFISICIGAASLTLNSISLYNALNPGWCGVCIERNTNMFGAINMNFEDVAGEGNWNLERFDPGLQRDCTDERISGSRQLRKVQFFPHDGIHCVCRIHISCHKGISGFDRAWVNLDGDFLTNHWLRTWPGGNPTKSYCPAGCVMLSKKMEGMYGMNVMNEALNCAENDNECKHRYVQMWD